jgi:hypothetical protein
MAVKSFNCDGIRLQLTSCSRVPEKVITLCRLRDICDLMETEGSWERREKCTRFWWESPKETDHLEDQGIGGKMGSEWIFGRLA